MGVTYPVQWPGPLREKTAGGRPNSKNMVNGTCGCSDIALRPHHWRAGSACRKRSFSRSPCILMPKIHYTRFPITSLYTGKLRPCCGLVGATSWQQVVVNCNTNFGKLHGTTDTTADFCPRQLVTDLLFMLRTWYAETGVMDFGL